MLCAWEHLNCQIVLCFGKTFSFIFAETFLWLGYWAWLNWAVIHQSTPRHNCHIKIPFPFSYRLLRALKLLRLSKKNRFKIIGAEVKYKQAALSHELGWSGVRWKPISYISKSLLIQLVDQMFFAKRTPTKTIWQVAKTCLEVKFIARSQFKFYLVSV